jgi:CubicO group peptidase (beta-lactamase class C family)
MRRNIALLAILGLVAGSLIRAAQPSAATLDALLDEAVAKYRVPLAVAMVADGGGVVYEHAAGVDKDAIFAIASMTKPVTSVAVMQLVEAGKVKLDEPAATYVQELGVVAVADGGSLRPLKSPLTVRQLLTHTSGFGYEFMNRNIFDRVAQKQLPSMLTGGDGFLAAPLLFEPGTRWEYGISTDWLGRLVERVSGQSLDVYLREKIFQPLQMTDTYFNVPPDKQSRLAPLYQRSSDGGLAKQPRAPQQAAFLSGGGGLHSTASDYLRFVRALMGGGQLDGARILSAESVALMGSNQIGDLTIRPFPSLIPQLATDGAALPGALDKFGLGFAINSGTSGTARGANTMAWAGIMNTFFWIDREKRIGAVLMSQMLPGLDPGPATLLEDFDRAVYKWKGSAASPRQPR